MKVIITNSQKRTKKLVRPATTNSFIVLKSLEGVSDEDRERLEDLLEEFPDGDFDPLGYYTEKVEEDIPKANYIQTYWTFDHEVILDGTEKVGDVYFVNGDSFVFLGDSLERITDGEIKDGWYDAGRICSSYIEGFVAPILKDDK